MISKIANFSRKHKRFLSISQNNENRNDFQNSGKTDESSLSVISWQIKIKIVKCMLSDSLCHCRSTDVWHSNNVFVSEQNIKLS